jgi:hypothetical protein
MAQGQGHRVTEKQMANLRPCKPGETHNPNGRPRKLVTAIKSIPRDMQEKVYAVLAYALTLPDIASAKKYLQCQEGELGKYGFVLQIAVKQLCKEGWGWNALMDIMDRLYGKPRISAEVAHTGGITLNIVTDQETKDAIEGGLG